MSRVVRAAQRAARGDERERDQAGRGRGPDRSSCQLPATSLRPVLACRQFAHWFSRRARTGTRDHTTDRRITRRPGERLQSGRRSRSGLHHRTAGVDLARRVCETRLIWGCSSRCVPDCAVQRQPPSLQKRDCCSGRAVASPQTGGGRSRPLRITPQQTNSATYPTRSSQRRSREARMACWISVCA
jgi:hypothetical protein